MMNLTEVTASWDNLEENLRKGKYDAIFTTMPRYNFNLHTYDFSEPYLYVGPILLIRSDSTFHDLKNLRNKEVAIVKESHHDLILEKIPEIIIRTYPDIPSMLQALMDGRVDGAILPILIAEQYVQNLYNGRIKMVQKPLTSEALRLVTLHKENEKMRAAFNHAIKKVKSSGNYNKLLKKYNLINLPLEE